MFRFRLSKLYSKSKSVDIPSAFWCQLNCPSLTGVQLELENVNCCEVLCLSQTSACYYLPTLSALEPKVGKLRNSVFAINLASKWFCTFHSLCFAKLKFWFGVILGSILISRITHTLHTKRLLSPSGERIKDLKMVNFFQLSTCQVGCVIVRAGNLHMPIDLCLVCWKDNELSEYSSIVSSIYASHSILTLLCHVQSWIFGLLWILKLLRQSAFLKLSWPPCCLAGITDTWPDPTHSLCCAECTTARKMRVNCQHTNNPNLHIFPPSAVFLAPCHRMNFC